MPIITGTDNPDVLVGTLGDDTIVGMSGDDSILAGRGDNIIFGNQGNDILRAGRGQDTLMGGRDNDQLFGNEQDNILSGDVGDDTLFAVDGENILFGNDGNDVLVGGLGNDLLYGGQGNDTIWAERGNNLVSGDRGADVLIGGTGENIFIVNINQGGPNIEDAEQILRFKANDKIALLGGPEGQTVDESAINIAFIRREANSTRGDFVLTNLATGEFLAVIRNVRRSTLTDESFTEDLTLSDTPDPGPPQPPVVDPEDELPPAPDPGDTTTDPQPPPTPGPGTPPVIEPPVDEDDPDDPADPGDPDDPADPDDPDPIDPEDNTPPTVEDETVALDLNSSRSLSGSLDGDDIDGQALTFNIAGGPANGTISGFDANTGQYSYFPNLGFLGTDTFTYRANDGIENSAEATVTVNVSVTDPIIDLDKQATGVDTSATYIEGQGPVDVAGSNIFLAAASNEITEVKVTLVNPSGGNQSLSFDTTVATAQNINVVEDNSGVDSVLTLTPDGVASLGAAAYQAVIETIKFDYDSVEEDPDGGDRTVNFVVTDNGDPKNTAQATSTITVTPVNDPPEITIAGPPPQPIKDVPFDLDDVLLSFVDPDVGNGEMTLTLSVTGAAGGTISASGSDLATSGNGTANVTIQGTLSDLNAGEFTYTAAEEGEVDISLTLSDNGNTGKVFDGGGNEIDNVQTVSVTQDFEVIEQTFEGISEMTITVIGFGGADGREVVLPASAFVASGKRDNVTITEIISGPDGTNIELGNNGIRPTDSGETVTVQVQNLATNPSQPGKFQYTISDGAGNSDTKTVAVTYTDSTGAGGDTDNRLPPGDPINPSDGINILYGRGEISNALIGGPGDDFLVAPQNSDYLYGGAGNDTLVGGNYPLDEGPADSDDNGSDRFVFDYDDIVVDGQGFDVTDLNAITSHPYYNTIMTFNWGAPKGWATDGTGTNDVIWLNNFKVDGNNLDFNNHISQDVKTLFPSSPDDFLNSPPPPGDDERIFGFVDSGVFYLLYDENGDPDAGVDTYIIARFTGQSDTALAGDVLQSGDFNLTQFPNIVDHLDSLF